MELVFDNIKKPINVGACIRLACAANAKIYFTGHSVKHTNRKAKLSAVGYEDVAEVEYIEGFKELVLKLKAEGKQVIGTSPYAEKCYIEVDYSSPTVFVFGNEGTGLSKENLDLCDTTVYIPMDSRVESLNLTTSAAILAYEALRQREFNFKSEV